MAIKASVAESPQQRRGSGKVRQRKSRAFEGLKLAAERHQEMTLLRSGKVRVPSRANAGFFWTVDPDSGVCPCPDCQTRNMPCAHIFAADFFAEFRAAVGASVSYTVEEADRDSWGTKRFYVCESSAENRTGKVTRVSGPAQTREQAIRWVIEEMRDLIGRSQANAEAKPGMA